MTTQDRQQPTQYLTLPPHPEPPSCHSQSPTEGNLAECLALTLEILRQERDK